VGGGLAAGALRYVARVKTYYFIEENKRKKKIR
jgi:hypothetical protein